MVQRLTYRRCHSYAIKSNQHRVIKTPGGKLVYQTTKKRASGPKCPVTCKRIQGVHLFDFVLARLNFNCSRLFISSSKNNNPDQQQQEVTRREVILRSSGLAVIGAIFHFSGTKPNYLDVQKNPPSLALCPATNKCISTSENISDLVHYAPPWNYNPPEGRGSKKPVSKEVAMEELLEVVLWRNIIYVWSCGVTLYVMLVGAYPFEDPEEPKNFHKTIQRILNVQYSIPPYVHISPECRHLISRIFVADPAKRITMDEIKSHEWFVKNLPAELTKDNAMDQFDGPDQPTQSVDEIMQIIVEATIPPVGANNLNQYLTGSLDIDDDMDEDLESDADLDIDSSGEIVYAM